MEYIQPLLILVVIGLIIGLYFIKCKCSCNSSQKVPKTALGTEQPPSITVKSGGIIDSRNATFSDNNNAYFMQIIECYGACEFPQEWRNLPVGSNFALTTIPPSNPKATFIVSIPNSPPSKSILFANPDKPSIVAYTFSLALVPEPRNPFILQVISKYSSDNKIPLYFYNL